ncbi:MAG TPA: nuclear transport factor 2 family protein [Dehalococcoidia bacterium]|nr:nuclear transport factor 2 family protein [Dehalococcoidia bacterium]
MPQNEMTAQDRLDVLELIARYAQCIDGGDLDGYVDNFLPGGVIEWANGVANGREEIRSWVGGLMATGRIGGEPAFTRHFVNLPYIYDGDGQRCSARTYVIIFTLDVSGKVTVPSVGSYTDTCVKTEHGWRFARRIIASDLGSFTRASD